MAGSPPLLHLLGATMRISDIIDRVQREFPGQDIFTDSWIINQLSILDQKIKRDIFDTHECEQRKEELKPYDFETDRDTELYVKAPFDDILYTDYILAMCNLELKEDDDYNIRINMFEQKEENLWKAVNSKYRFIVPQKDYRF